MTSRSGADIFWGEFSPCEHIVQLYSDESQFLQLLEGFVAGGLAAGESVILIATSVHLQELERHLGERYVDLKRASQRDHYIALEVESVLPLFMHDGWPDEERFEAFVEGLLERATRGGRRVRVFGEIVAVLWDQGHCDATVRLEHLWDRLGKRCGFPLFCAYPRSGFVQDTAATVQEICCAHTRVLHA